LKTGEILSKNGEYYKGIGPPTTQYKTNNDSSYITQ